MDANPDTPSDADLRRDAAAVAELLLARGLMLVTAESCTGGWIAKTLTDLPGSSAWFEAGVVAYSYEAKEALLGVNPRTLERSGAVSEETVMEMVSGALARFGAGVAVATPVGFSLLAASAPPERLGRTMGAGEVGRELGDAGGPMLVGAFAGFGLTAGFVALAAALAAVGGLALPIRRSARRSELEPDGINP